MLLVNLTKSLCLLFLSCLIVFLIVSVWKCFWAIWVVFSAMSTLIVLILMTFRRKWEVGIMCRVGMWRGSIGVVICELVLRLVILTLILLLSINSKRLHLLITLLTFYLLLVALITRIVQLPFQCVLQTYHLQWLLSLKSHTSPIVHLLWTQIPLVLYSMTTDRCIVTVPLHMFVRRMLHNTWLGEIEGVVTTLQVWGV